VHRVIGAAGTADASGFLRRIPCCGEFLVCRELIPCLTRIDSLFRCAGNFRGVIRQATGFAVVFVKVFRRKRRNRKKFLWVCIYCNPLKSHKTAKTMFGKAWHWNRRSLEILAKVWRGKNAPKRRIRSRTPRALDWSVTPSRGCAPPASVSPIEVGVRLCRDHIRLPARGLERDELAVDQRRRHVMADPTRDAGAHFFGGRLQIDEAQFWPGRRAQPVAIGAPQRGAGDDRALAFRELGPDSIEPGPAVLVGQRMAGFHLGAGRVGVQIVAIDEFGAEGLREAHSDRRLAGARDAHHDDRDAFRGRR